VHTKGTHCDGEVFQFEESRLTFFSGSFASEAMHRIGPKRKTASPVKGEAVTRKRGQQAIQECNDNCGNCDNFGRLRRYVT
jgi:hypothetical protein